MQKYKKRLLYVMMVCALLIAQLSNALVALAESETPLKATDFGDSNLYAYLAAVTDPNGNKGGILYKEDAEALTALDMLNYYSGDTKYETASKIESFANLAKYCPNLERIQIGSYIGTAAVPSLVEEIVKLDNLTSITLNNNNVTGEQLKSICGKNNAAQVTQLSFYVNDTVDFSALEGMSSLTSVSLHIESNASVENAASFAKLEKVTSVDITGYQPGVIQEMINNLPVATSSLDLNSYTSGSNGNAVYDFSKAAQLRDVYVYGSLKGVTGLKALENLEGLSIYGYSSNRCTVNLEELPQSLQYMYLSSCDFGTSVVSGLPTSLRSLRLSGCGITEVSGLTDCTNLQHLDLGSNKLSVIPDITGLSLYNLDISSNQLTDASVVNGLSTLNSIDLSNNKLTSIPDLSKSMALSGADFSRNEITDISGIANNTSLYQLNLSYNNIETLPDLTAFTKLVGYYYSNYDDTYFTSDNCYKLSLKGNKLTSDAIKGKVPEDCENDKYWMYASTMQRTSRNQAYFKEVNTEILSKLLENDSYASVYTSQKNVTLDEELVTYIKDNAKNLSLYYVSDKGDGQSVSVSGSSLQDTTKTIDLEFDSVTSGVTTPEIQAAFGAYGESSYYAVIPERKQSGIEGVNYYSSSIHALDSDKTYHAYVYNKESNTFTYATTYRDTEYIYLNSYIDSDAGNYYFLVEDDKDTLMGTDVYQVNNGSYEYTSYNTYYKQFNDDVVKGLVYGNRSNSSNYVIPSQITLSAETVSLLKEKSKTFHIYSYDTQQHTSLSRAYISAYALEEGTLDISLPVVTVSDSNAEVEAAFTGGTPTKYYTVKELPKNVAGLSYYMSIRKNTSYSSNNLYTYYNGTCIPISVNSYSSGEVRLDENAEKVYFEMPSAEDQFVKTETIQEGDYKGTNYTYYTDTSSAYVEQLVRYNATHFASAFSYKVLSDKIELSAGAVKLLRENNRVFSIYYYSAETGRVAGSADVRGYSIPENAETITVEKPEVEFTTGNEAFEKLLPAGTAAVYVTPKSNMADGVTYYYTDATVLGSKLESGELYTRLIIKGDGTLGTKGTVYGGSTLPLTRGTVALVKSADYDTPSDTPSVDTPSDTPDVDTPSDTPDVDTPSDTPTEPEEVPTEPIEPTEPEEVPTKPTQPEQPAEPTQPEVEQPTSQLGVNSVAQTVAEDKLTQAGEVNNVLTDKLNNSNLAAIDVVSKGAAPKLSSNVFEKLKENQKDITVGVTDENNRLQYSWTFDSDTVNNTNMDIDLSISFDTDRAEAVKQITGREDLVYLSFAHHGQLPGPAKIKTYVGSQYKNGDVVYLYYFNEEKNRVESVGGKNQGLVVTEGYVEYTITHCSVYFLSTQVAEEVNAVDPKEEVEEGTPVVAIPDSVNDSTPTGDTANVVPYVIATIAALLVFGAVAVVGRKKKEQK